MPGADASDTISIRKANADDAPAAWSIRAAAISSQCTGYYEPEELQLWTAGEMTGRFSAAVADSFYVATMDGRVVGTGMIDLKIGKLDAIFVHPDHMAAGVGRLIVSHLEKLAIEAGLAQVNLESTLNAAAFYRSCGFVRKGISKYNSPSGASLDCILMTKRLRSFGS